MFLGRGGGRSQLLRASSQRGLALLIFRASDVQGRKKVLVKKNVDGGEYIDLDSYIHHNNDQMTVQELVSIFLESSKQKVRIGPLNDVAKVLRSGSKECSANALSVVAYGLQLYSSSDRGARLVLEAICDVLETGIVRTSAVGGEEVGSGHLPGVGWTPLECSNALYGLGEMSSSVPEVQRLLAMLPLCTRPFAPNTRVSAKMLAKGLYGFRSMSSDDPDTRLALAFYGRFLAACDEALDEQSLSYCLMGLQGCSSEHKEVRDVLAALLALTRRPPALALQPKSVGAALLGLRRMNNSHAVVDELVETLAAMAHRGEVGSGAGYDAYTIGSAMLGLQQMHARVVAVQSVLSLLRRQLERVAPSRLSELALVNMFFGLQSMGSEVAEVRQLLRELTDKLAQWTRLSSSPPRQLSLRGVCTCLFGLRGMSASHPEVTLAMRVLREQLALVPSHRAPGGDAETLNSKMISLASAVFQNMTSNNVEVRRMVKTQAAVWSALGGRAPAVRATSSVRKASAPFRWDSQAVGNVLYNMRNLSNEHLEVQDLLQVVWEQGLQHLQGGPENLPCLSPLSLSHSLYGLRCMTSEHGMASLGPVLESLSEELFRHLTMLQTANSRALPPGVLSAKEICVALYGLQGCSDAHHCVRRLVHVCAALLDESAEKGGADLLTVSNAFLGLQSMSNEGAQVERLLRTLLRHLAQCDIRADYSGDVAGLLAADGGAAAANILYGVQAMTLIPAAGEDAVLGSLVRLVRDDLVLPHSATYSPDSAHRALYGVASLLSNSVFSSAPTSLLSLLDIAEALVCRLTVLAGLDEKELGSVAPREVLAVYRALNLLQHSLRSVLVHSDLRVQAQVHEMREKAAAILVHLQPLLPESDDDHNSSSVTEMAFHDHLEQHFQQRGLHLELSVHLSELVDGFSTDLLVRGPTGIVLNIEIDGPSHQFPRKRRFMAMRDACLREARGVEVLRVDLRGSGFLGSKLQTALQEVSDAVEEALAKIEKQK